MQSYPNEYPLEDDYPIYQHYWYVVNNEPIRSPIKGTVKDLKEAMRTTEIYRCNAVKRGLPTWW